MEVITVAESKEFFDKSRKTPYLTVIVKIPEELYPPIESIQKELQRIDSRQLYCPSNYFHITLKGIGSLGASIEKSKMPKIVDALERAARATRSFHLEFRSLGIFPDVIYVGISEGAKSLRQLHLSLIRELKDLAPPRRLEGPEMIPHLTVMLFTTKDVDLLLTHVKRLDEIMIPSMEVEKFTLVSSHAYRLLERQTENEQINEETNSFELN